ncbi:hypothetical protein BDQ17DRAFT_146112 [Cyathus striatus]|nr:hypothetical protein BDQ17DRAFT_146112 [Cyathus striatus]
MSAPSDSEVQRSENGHHTPSASWRPTITAYHLLVVFFIIWISTTKLVLCLRAGLHPVITALGFMLYPVLSIMKCAVDKYSSAVEVAKLSWFLRSDIFRYLSTDHDTEKKEDISSSNHVPIRGFDLLYTIVTLLFGIIRGTLANVGFTTGAIIVDYIGTLFIGICLFCLEQYEFKPSKLTSCSVDYRGS